MFKWKSKTKMQPEIGKPEMEISLNTLYGSKYLMYLINFALISIVIILSIFSAYLYFLMPVADFSKLPVKAGIQETVETLSGMDSSGDDPSEAELLDDQAYAVITNRNIFSPQRKEWVVTVVKMKPVEFAVNKNVRKKVSTEKPTKIILHGIVIAGNLRKALINNPLTGISKNKTLYVEEGEKVEGYTVTSIESDLIRLDWQGEEVIVTLYSGISGQTQVYEDDKLNENEISSLQEEKIRENRRSYAEVFDESTVNLMSMEPERIEGQ